MVTAVVEQLWCSNAVQGVSPPLRDAYLPMLPMNSTLIPSCASFLPSRTRTVICANAHECRALARVPPREEDLDCRKRTYLTGDRLSVIVDRAGNGLLLLAFDFNLLPFVLALKLNVHIDRRREEVGSHDEGKRESRGAALAGAASTVYQPERWADRGSARAVNAALAEKLNPRLRISRMLERERLSLPYTAL